MNGLEHVADDVIPCFEHNARNGVLFWHFEGDENVAAGFDK